MNTQAKIIILLFIAVIFAAIGIWQLVNARGIKSRGHRRAPGDSDNADSSQSAKNQRRSDKRQLTSLEKKLFAESQRLLTQGKISAGARILEQLSMTREAIQALEDHGLIHEAARILMRMQKNDRAGVVYARHGMWENASQCFRIANMPLEAAKCAREGGNLTSAAEFFEKAEYFEEAAECHVTLKNYQQAFRFFHKANNNERALAMLEKIVTTETDPHSLEFQESEFERIVSAIANDAASPKIIQFFANHKKLVSGAILLLKKGAVKQVAEVYQLSGSDIGPQLIAEIRPDSQEAEFLGEVFRRIDKHVYAGMVFEKLSKFGLAGESFEKAGDLDRAIYSYDRANLQEKSSVLRAQLKQNPRKIKKSKKPDTLRVDKNISNSGDIALFKLENTRGTETDSDDSLFKVKNIEPEGQIVEKNPSKQAANEPLQKINSENLFSLDKIQDTQGKSDPLLNSSTNQISPPNNFNPSSDISKIQIEPSQSSTEKDSKPLELVASIKAQNHSLSIPSPAISNPLTPPESSPSPTEKLLQPVTNAFPGHPQGSFLQSVLSNYTEAPSQAELDAFYSCKFLQDFSDNQKRQLWDLGHDLVFNSNSTILDYDGNPLGLYVVTKGQVSCYRKIGGEEIHLETIGAGDSFGELWLLTDLPTTVCFRTKTDSALRVVPRDRFSMFIEQDGIIARKVYKKFTSRLLRSLLKNQNSQKNPAAS